MIIALCHFRSMAVFLIIVDGAADRPITQLAGKTPWEIASTPNLDQLTRYGIQGLVDVVPGIAPESDNGSMALLGYNPHVYYTGRGPLEGLGAGFFEDGQHTVCFRINFASWSHEDGYLSRRTSRGLSDAELQELAQDLRTQVQLEAPFPVSFDLKAYGRHRGLLCIKSPTYPLGFRVSNTDPLFRQAGAFGIPVPGARLEPKRCEPQSYLNEDVATAELVNQFVEKAARVLGVNPINVLRRSQGKGEANFVLVRDGGRKPLPLPAFQQRFGHSVSFHGQIAAEKGLMSLVGGNYFSAIPTDGESNPAFFRRMAYELVYGTNSGVRCIHFVKDADEAGHDNDPEAKVQALEEFDSFFLASFTAQAPAGSVIIICSDHATPCDLGIHSADPVPVLIVGLDVTPDPTTTFGESPASRGSLRIAAGCDIMPFVFSHLQSVCEFKT